MLTRGIDRMLYGHLRTCGEVQVYAQSHGCAWMTTFGKVSLALVAVGIRLACALNLSVSLELIFETFAGVDCEP